MKRKLALALSLAMVACCAYAQTDAPKEKSSRPSSSKELQEMKDAIAAQQQQIQQLQQQVTNRDQAIQQLQSQIAGAQSAAQAAQQTANGAVSEDTPQNTNIDALQHELADNKALDATTVNELQETQKRVGALESPAAIHYKGVLITPGGFLAAETVYRSHATFGDINTPLSSIPFSAQAQARQGEFYGSGRQSRMSWLIQGKMANMNLTGYYEMDFLGAGVTSNNNQSNSYVMRQRQVYAQAALKNGWTFTGGQMWSLVTETKVGLDNRTEATPMQIDAQYVAGFSWNRQYGFRVTKNFNNSVWLGFSIENAQTLNPAGTLPSVTAGGTTYYNYTIGGPGTLGGLYNSLANYASNESPGFVVKLAFQPKWKIGGHYEVFGVGQEFRNRIYPHAFDLHTAAGAYNNSKLGGGIGGNARWLAAQKKVEFGVHFLGGNGAGRYGDDTLADVTIFGDGTEHFLRSYQGLASLEFHLPKWDWYFYAGGDYAGRNWQRVTLLGTSSPTNIGYGSPRFVDSGCGTETLPSGAGGFLPGSLASCSGNTKDVVEGTVGFWYKPYIGPKGRLQMGLQYSYLERNAWSGAKSATSGFGAINPTAIENMIFTSFRYYLP